MNDTRFDEKGWDKDGWHQMHYAAYEGDLKELKKLLEKSESVNLKTNDVWSMPPMHIAARRGHVEAVDVLLNCKADIDKPDGQGWSALMHAAVWGRKRCVELLLKRNANRTVSTTSGLDTGRTALDLAKSTSTGDQREIKREIIAMLEAEPAPEAPPAPFPAYAAYAVK